MTVTVAVAVMEFPQASEAVKVTNALPVKIATTILS